MVSLTPSLKCAVFLCFSCTWLDLFYQPNLPIKLMGYTALSTSFSLLPFPFSVFISWLDHFDDNIDNVFAKELQNILIFYCVCRLKCSWCNSCLQICNPSTYHSFSSLSMVLSHSDSKFSLFDKTT